ncbi:MAG: MATE family efflux transporter [Lachnospiraceae bacterium]|nr:MATE family efflux transporter [Lachnospiraceae bacterium]
MSTAAQKNINFTAGAIVPKLILFSVPIVISELLQSLYNSVDALVVGKYVSSAALAAVSVCGPITNLLIGFFNGMSIGNTVMVAKAFGSGDEEETRRAVRYAFTFSIALGVAVSALGIALAAVLLHLTGCNDEIYGEAIVYLRIYLAGLMFTVIYNCGTGILRAVGDSRSPLFVLAVSSVLNILLDLLFVGAFGWGTAGVGVATILSQGTSVLLVHRLIRRRIRSRAVALGETWREGRRQIASSVSVGFSAGVQNALVSFSNIFVWSYINAFPTAVSAGIGAAVKIDRFVILPCKAMTMTTTTYVSQNLGGGQYERARRGIWYGLGLSAAVTALMSFPLLFFAEPAAGLFSDEPAVIEAAVSMIRFFLPFYGAMVVREVLLGYLRGYGKTRIPMILTLLAMVALRQTYLALATERWPGKICVVNASFPFGWTFAMLFLLCYTLLIRKKMWRDAEKTDR